MRPTDRHAGLHPDDYDYMWSNARPSFQSPTGRAIFPAKNVTSKL